MPSRLLSAPTFARAVGEVLIIVVGVLIALAADAWWTGRQERAEAREYLSRFADDISNDRFLLRANRSVELRRTEAADALLEWMEHPDAPPRDSLRTLLNRTRGGSLQPMRTGTWIDLRSNGRLTLIESAELRDALLAYYERVVPINEAVLRLRETFVATELQSRMMHHIDGRVLYGSAAADPSRYPIVTSWNEFRTEPDVAGLVRTRSAQGTDRAGIYEAQVLPAVQCVLLRLADAGADVDPEADDPDTLRARCGENGV